MTDPAKVFLFSYGTLQLEAVQLSCFGRRLRGHHDAMPGYRTEMLKIDDSETVRLSGKEFHPVVVPTGNPADEVQGTLFEITESELLAADRYEVDDYKRVEAQMKSGRHAWVYVKAA
jgi:gamma-glutamylcyclotransferase (GGCT)/AIG2-like uncharacterized protein YtfP